MSDNSNMENQTNEFENEEDTIVVEEAFVRMAEIVSALENPKINLQESLKLYAEGVKLATACHEKLEGVEKEMQIINGRL